MKANKKWLSLLVIASLLASTGAGFADTTSTGIAATSVVETSSMVVGNTYEGFKLVKKQWSDEAASTIYQFEHEKTGGKVLYFENEDRHKAFDIFFKTPVKDNTGVNHILEHSVLSGSEKYPTKSPFMTMAQTSVNTFANALTYSDHTAYPFSSQNDKDFSNLMSVYLDAVFAPKIVTDSKIFEREGWGYELDQKSGKLNYKGVVFSEMKGSMSDPTSILYDAFDKNLFPNTSFAYNSGGDPEAIVTLTHAQLVETYKKYYHPSNATVYLYGKMDIGNKLKQIHEDYFNKYEKKTINTDYGKQKPFAKTKYASVNYHVDKGTNLSKKTMISVGYGLQDMSKKDMLAMGMLVSLLSNLEISPMKTAFMDSGIGQSFYGSMNMTTKAPSVEFCSPDTDINQKLVLEKFVQTQLNNMVKNGFDKELIKSSLNSVDLSNRLTKLSADKGNSLRDTVEIGQVCYDDPLYFLDQDAMVEEIKQDALNNRYFENLIDKYLLKNTHKLVLTLEPKVDYNKASEQRLNAKLAAYKKSLSPQSLEALKTKLGAFEKWKNEPDTDKDLATLPTLELKDINCSVKTGDYEIKTISNIPVIEHLGSTNKTVGLSYYFDLSTLTKEEIRDLAIYTGTFSVMGTKNKNLDALTKAVMTETGGVSVDTSLVTSDDYYTIKSNKLVFDSVFLESNTNNAMALINEMATSHVYDDVDMLKYYIEDLSARYNYYYMNEGDDLAWETLNQTLTPSGQYGYMDAKDTFEYYDSLLKNWKTESPKLIERLAAIQKKALNINGLQISLVGEKSAMAAAENNIAELAKGLQQEKFPEIKVDFKPSSPKIGLTMPSQVQYVYKGFNTHQTGGKIEGSTFVFTQFMNNEYLYPTIRVQGGAYGGSMFASKNGNVVFSSYRDPGLAKTLEAIDQAPAYLKKLNLTQADINPYIIAALGSFDAPMSIFEIASSDDYRLLGGKTVAQEEALMKAIMATTPADLKAFIQMIESGLKKGTVVVTGSEAELQKNKKLLETIKNSVE